MKNIFAYFTLAGFGRRCLGGGRFSGFAVHQPNSHQALTANPGSIMPALAAKTVTLHWKAIPKWSKRARTIGRTFKFAGFFKMKTSVPLLALAVLAAVALAGCDQTPSAGSTDASAANSSTNRGASTASPATNPPAILMAPSVYTNRPVTTNQS
jgi:hypothetical protein